MHIYIRVNVVRSVPLRAESSLTKSFNGYKNFKDYLYIFVRRYSYKYSTRICKLFEIIK